MRLARLFFPSLILPFLLLLPIAPGAQVTLGTPGRVVPADSILVFIFLGHSNMAGRAVEFGTTDPDSIQLITSTYNDTDPHIWTYYLADSYNTLAATGTWIPAQKRIQNDFVNNLEIGNAAMPFLKKARNYFPEHHLGVIQIGCGYAELRTHFIQDATLYGSRRWSVLRNALEDLKGKVTIAGVITDLGIIEVRNRNLTAIGTYAADLDTLIQRIRTIAENPYIPLLSSDLELGASGGWAINNEYGDSLRSQFQQVQNGTTPKVRIIDTEWSRCSVGVDCALLYGDDHHYNRKGMHYFADAAVDAFIQTTPLVPDCNPQDPCAPYPALAPLYAGSSSSQNYSSSAQLSSSAAPLSSSSSEMLSSSSSAINGLVFTQPVPGTEARVGETIFLTWTTDRSFVFDAYPEVSLDGGRTWQSIGVENSVVPEDPQWENIPWTIPATLPDRNFDEVPLAGKTVHLQLRDYGNTSRTTTTLVILDAVVSIMRTNEPRPYLGLFWRPAYDLSGRRTKRAVELP